MLYQQAAVLHGAQTGRAAFGPRRRRSRYQLQPNRRSTGSNGFVDDGRHVASLLRNTSTRSIFWAADASVSDGVNPFAQDNTLAAIRVYRHDAPTLALHVPATSANHRGGRWARAPPRPPVRLCCRMWTMSASVSGVHGRLLGLQLRDGLAQHGCVQNLGKTPPARVRVPAARTPARRCDPMLQCHGDGRVAPGPSARSRSPAWRQRRPTPRHRPAWSSLL